MAKAKAKKPAVFSDEPLKWTCDETGVWLAKSQKMNSGNVRYWVIEILVSGEFFLGNSDAGLITEKTAGSYTPKTLQAAQNICQSMEDGIRVVLRREAGVS